MPLMRDLSQKRDPLYDSSVCGRAHLRSISGRMWVSIAGTGRREGGPFHSSSLIC